MKKMIIICNWAIIMLLAIFWIRDIMFSFSFDSLIFTNESFEDSRISTLYGIFGIVIITIILVFGVKSNKIIVSQMSCIAMMSFINLIVFWGDIAFYLPIYHNEQFIVIECFIIFLSLFSILAVIISGLYYVTHKEQSI